MGSSPRLSLGARFSCFGAVKAHGALARRAPGGRIGGKC